MEYQQISTVAEVLQSGQEANRTDTLSCEYHPPMDTEPAVVEPLDIEG